MKKTVLIPAPSFAAVRHAPIGKHSRGCAAKKQLGALTHPPLADGKLARNAKKRSRSAFIAESQRQGVEIARQKADARAYRLFYDGLSPADKAFARAHGLHRPLSDSRRPDSNDALDYCESDEPRELVPHAGVGSRRSGSNYRPLVANDHPVLDELEPENLSVDLEALTPEEISETSEIIDRALRWALDGEGLVGKGRRSLVIIVAMRRDFAHGLEIEPELARGFIAELHCSTRSEQKCAVTALHAAGRAFDRFLEWMRRGSSLSAIGERLEMVAYILRPDLIDSATLAKLGEATNKSRQAKDKGANCFRDTFSSLKALAMRPDITRLRCQLAHT